MPNDRSYQSGPEPVTDAETLGRAYEPYASSPPEPADGSGPGGPSEPETTTPPPLERIVEAILFVGGPPLTSQRAAEVVRGLTPALFSQAVDALNREYRRQGRPYAIRPQEQGFVLALKPRFLALRERLYGGPREARLSPAAVDVLALVAYRQPATKQEVDSLRGAESGVILRQLVRRGLITILHRGDSARREVSYGTTLRFLELFGLSSLDDLPQTQDLQLL
jgi:segregation and condensation protein B